MLERHGLVLRREASLGFEQLPTKISSNIFSPGHSMRPFPQQRDLNEIFSETRSRRESTLSFTTPSTSPTSPFFLVEADDDDRLCAATEDQTRRALESSGDLTNDNFGPVFEWNEPMSSCDDSTMLKLTHALEQLIHRGIVCSTCLDLSFTISIHIDITIFTSSGRKHHLSSWMRTLG